MTDEKKIEDLLARMAAMTPQPPPFPEETTTVTQKTPTPRRSPALIFAAAAIAVVALAVPLLFMNGDRQPVGSGSTTTLPQSTTVPEPQTIVTTAPETTTTVPGETPEVLATWTVFLAQEASEPDGRPAIVPYTITVTKDSGIPFDRVDSPEDLLVNLEDLEVSLPQGYFFTAVPDAVEIVGKKFEQTSGGLTRVTLDMNEAFLQGTGDATRDYLMLEQLVFTTLQNDVDELVFTVGGKAVTSFGAEGIDLSGPLGGLDFADRINTIIVTQPVVVSNGTYTVRGIANVFEASLAYRVVDTDIDGHVMATCGTGCWGEFEITFDAPDGGLADGAVLEIFVHSAEDGRPINFVRIPLTRDQVFELAN